MSYPPYGPPAAPYRGAVPFPHVEIGGPPVPHRPWSTVLVALNAMSALGGVVATVSAGRLLVVEASPANQSTFATLGLVIVSVVLGVALLVLAVAVLLTVLTVRGRRAADQGRPRLLTGVAITDLSLGGLGVLAAAASGSPATAAAGLLVPLLFALPAIMLLRTLRSTAPPVMGRTW